MRRLLILPAALLVLLGTPVFALEDTTPPPATSAETPVVPADSTVSEGWRSAPIPVDANLIGVTWEGDPDAEFTVEVQGADGAWTTPTEIDADAGQAEEGTQDAAGAAQLAGTASEPVWVGDDATAVRIVLADGQASDVALATVDAEPAPAPGGAAGAISGWLPYVDGPGRIEFAVALLAVAAALGAVALGWSPWRVLGRRQAAATLALGAIVLASCVPPPPPAPSAGGGSGGGSSGTGAVQPGMIARSQWGARPFGTGPVPCPAGPEQAPALEFAVVHHTVNSNSYGPADSAAMMRAIQTYHMNVNGYCDIAYNFIVDRYGQTYEARDGGSDRPIIGGHSGGFNTGSVGVALLGDHTASKPTSDAWNALVHLLAWRFSAARVDPSTPTWHTVGSSPCNCQNWPVGTVIGFVHRIVWHRDLNSTACPGNALVPDIGALRDQVQAGISIPPPTTTSTSTTSTSTTSTTLGPTTTTT